MSKDWKIYTRKGDSGTTALIGGKIVSKSYIRVESYGLVDELNSFVGHLYDQVEDSENKVFLFGILNKLFLIESHLAVDPEAADKKFFPDIIASDTRTVELEIDRLNVNLPELTHFILPAGNKLASLAHICRTVCRRAERNILRLHETEPVDVEILKYINRLSDYFFVLARKLSHIYGAEDVPWIASPDRE
ncbi:MAG: ATP:cob(I)alamin adenosyltransferase [Bacteroidetes bacterium HGW-Bacteroidetes-6]|jgi:cob(I)alamin adenosyltransferase|nr:MAG: ATP:cob(I)alamin adenosyltransferase [Bacteroidetes bacterium HGW-Bacteroidetes-6]